MIVLHYITSIDRESGGIGSYMQLLAKPLGNLVQLHVVTHHSNHELTLENSQLHYIDNWNHYWKMKREFHDLLKDIHPDIVHVNCCWQPESALVQKWATKANYKTVYTPHGMLEPWIMQRHYWTKKVPALLLYQKAAIERSNVLHATADSERNNLLKLGFNQHVAVIPNGIDVNNIQIKSSWKRTKTLLFLSRIHIKKGLDILIEAVSELKGNMDGYQVMIAGEGDRDYISKLNELIKIKKVEDIVSFVGGVYEADKWMLYQKADVFVLPTHSENFGIVVAEALASGTPVITTTGTPWEELISKQCGWWIPCSKEDLKSALLSAIKLTEDQLELYGRNGRLLIMENYSVESIAYKMKTLYEWLLGIAKKPDFVYVE